ncbi:hypothetical protein LTR53_018213, partial [Teratosphaeriaceae sp. CCFEE 6253]
VRDDGVYCAASGAVQQSESDALVRCRVLVPQELARGPVHGADRLLELQGAEGAAPGEARAGADAAAAEAEAGVGAVAM